MNNLHKRVKQIFAAASGLQGEDRTAYLDQVCEDDTQLRREVESLLEFDTSQTIIEPRAEIPFKPDEARAIAPARSNFQATRFAAFTGWVTWLFAPRSRRFLISGLSLLLFALLGWWVYESLHQSLREIRETELQTILNADITAMRLWIEDLQAEADTWSNQQQLRTAAAYLIKANGTNGEESQKHAAFIRQTLAPFTGRKGSVGYVISDRNGIVLAASDKTTAGQRLSPAAFATTPEVFSGSTVFMRPQPASLFINGAGDAQEPLIWVSAPVHGADGQVIAKLSLSTLASHHFSQILTVARMGNSGESYAFDDRGLMLSESRFTAQLQEIGLLKDADSAVFQIEIRDPGADLTRGGAMPKRPKTQPLTTMAASATAGEKGMDLDGYRDYRGVEVIGAWEWLPEFNFGVASEVDREEAYAPLWYLHLAYGFLLMTLGVAIAGWLLSMVRIATMRRNTAGNEPLGQYKLEEKIGEGGMGVVYRAEHAMLQRPTAVKLLSNVSTASIARFEQEVKMACKLSHPNTIQIFDYGRTPDNRFYYAMELIEGLSLAEFARIEGQIPPARVVHIVRQICHSLREAHALGMIHRDIKPHNIMLCRRGGEADVVKVLDFGLVRNIDAPETREVRAGAGISGTPMYMSPERFSRPRDVDARCDIYATGAVAFRLLTGETLFRPAEFNALVYQIMNDIPQAPSELATGKLSPQLDEFTRRCLCKEITGRPASMDELLQMLDEAPEAHQWNQKAAQDWWNARFPDGVPQSTKIATAEVVETLGRQSEVQTPTKNSLS